MASKGYTDEIAVPTTSTVPPGWLPAAIGGRYTTVRWVHAEQTLLEEPFFHSSLAFLRAQTPAPRECETDLAALIYGLSHLPPVKPAGVIVHMSRCGSSAVINALRTAESTVTLGEASFIATASEFAASSSAHWSSVGKTLLVRILTAYAYYLGAPARNVIVKFGVDGPLSLKAFRSVWPDVPCLVLIRNPVEVMVSNVQKPAPWFYQLEAGFTPPVRNQPDAVADAESRRRYCVELGSQRIGAMCAEMLDQLDGSCTVVDYADLSAAVVLRIAGRFGLVYSDEGEAQLRTSFDQYSKDRRRTFAGDTAAKQRDATDNLKESVSRWASGPYQSLLERARIL